MKKLSTKTKNIIITSVVCTVALTTGVTLGIFFGDFVRPAAEVEGDPKSYESDNDKLYKKYADGEKTDYDSLEVYDLINAATYKFENSANHYSITKGMAETTVNQSVDTVSARNGDSYFMESISCSSMVSVAKRFYQDVDSLVEYNGTSIDKSGLSATWSEKIEFAEESEFENKWGKLPNRANIYSISKKTVTDSSKKVDSKGNFIVSVTLDPEHSIYRYQRQIISMSSLSKPPKFSHIKLTYTIDKNLNLVSREIDEQYVVNKLGTHDTHGVLVDTFYPDTEYKIPDLNTNSNYGGN